MLYEIHNPTNNDISIKFKGVDYSVKGNSFTPNVPEDAAKYWVEMLHNFLIMKKQKGGAVEQDEIVIDKQPVLETSEELDETEEEVEITIDENPKAKKGKTK